MFDSTLQLGSGFSSFYSSHGTSAFRSNLISEGILLLKSIMHSLSLKEVDATVIENEDYNFTYLNIDEDHPARGMHDTFYLKGFDNMLLRSHTSNAQIRAMASGKYRVPFGLFHIGRVYRKDQDSTHLPMFHQLEILILDHSLNIGHLKWIVKKIINSFFDSDTNIHFRPSYFPFTEPSMEVDMSNDSSNWHEVLGCGIVRQNIIQRYGYNTRGIAVGFGIERLLMLKHNIQSIHDLYSNAYVRNVT